MGSTRFLAVVAAAALCVTLAFGAVAQDTTSAQQKAMEAYMKLMAPNENHAFLANLVGDWTVQTKGWMEPGGAPSMSEGTAMTKLIMGGRFIMMEFHGSMFGQPFDGLQILGYDTMQKKYVSFWIDSSSTPFYMMSGTRDKATNVLNDTGMWPDPMTGGSMKVRDAIHVVSPNEYTYELFMTGADGKEFKTLEYTAMKKK